MSRHWRSLASLGLAILAGSVLATPAGAQQFFAPSSVWNSAIKAGAPLDAASSALVAELQRQRRSTTAWINTTENSTPLYRVSAAQPHSRVILDTTAAPALQDAFNSVPIPADARPAAGGDGSLLIWQPATDTLWEFWRLYRGAGGWHAVWGGRMQNVSDSPGYYRDREQAPGVFSERWFWGAPATSLSLAGGLITLRDLRHGRINHALQLAIPQPREGVWSFPAQRSDGNLDSLGAIPEGATFRLDPRLDLNALDLPPVTLMIARAAKRYGIIIDNVAGCVAFRAEDPTPSGTNPYPELFGHRTPRQLLDQFPWAHLQVLKMDLKSASTPSS